MQPPQSAMLLRIYTQEGKMNNHRPLYEDIVMRAREAKLAGATVLRGPMGYGLHAKIHTAKILDLSAKLPLVIEIVDSEDKIRSFLVELGGMTELGLVTLEKVEVIHYGSHAMDAPAP
jgi:PII-like signaling protein